MILLRACVLFLLVVKPSDIEFSIPLPDSTLTWSFYYANVLLEKGDLVSGLARDTVEVDREASPDLLVTLNYHGAEPRYSVLLVRNEIGFVLEYLYETPESQDALIPRIGAGPHFILPVQEIVGPVETAGSYKVSFALRDPTMEEEIPLGAVTFILK